MNATPTTKQTDPIEEAHQVEQQRLYSNSSPEELSFFAAAFLGGLLYNGTEILSPEKQFGIDRARKALPLVMEELALRVASGQIPANYDGSCDESHHVHLDYIIQDGIFVGVRALVAVPSGSARVYQVKVSPLGVITDQREKGHFDNLEQATESMHQQLYMP